MKRYIIKTDQGTSEGFALNVEEALSSAPNVNANVTNVATFEAYLKDVEATGSITEDGVTIAQVPA